MIKEFEFTIMLQNQIIMCASKYQYTLYQEKLLPWGLKGNVCLNDDSVSVYRKIINWAIQRMIHYNNTNGNWLWNYCFNGRSLYCDEVYNFILKYHLTSVYDEYWIKSPADTTTWEQINPKHNPINQKTADIQIGKAYPGQYAIGETDSLIMPAYTTYGNMQKAWYTIGDNTYLLKRNNAKEKNAQTEVTVSKLLDCFTDCKHVTYTSDFIWMKYRKKHRKRKRKEYVCKCEPVCADGYSFIHAEEVYQYCTHNQLTFQDFILEIAKEDILKMCIIDYIIGNPDRHLRNWGFIQDDSTGNLIGLAPLFDHDRSFEETDEMKSLIFPEKTMKEVAIEASQIVDVSFKKSCFWLIFALTKRGKEVEGRRKECAAIKRPD